MISQFFSKEPKTQTVDRSRILAMLEAANETGSYRFSRQAALSWLTSFPGDLEINLMYAKALVKENRYAHAAPVIQKILRADPEFAEAAILGEEVFSKSDAAFLPLVTGTIKALGGNPIYANKIPEWGFSLSRIRQAIMGNRITEAQNLIFDILGENENIELVSYYHLLTTNRLSDRSTLINLATLYHSRWPECIQIAIVLANALMDAGDTDEAVKLLHFCAASDPVGQVPVRLWGAKFPYKPLYPQQLSVQFDLPIPAEVAGKLGLNQLAGGPVVRPGDQDLAVGQHRLEELAALLHRQPAHMEDDPVPFKAEPLQEAPIVVLGREPRQVYPRRDDLARVHPHAVREQFLLDRRGRRDDQLRPRHHVPEVYPDRGHQEVVPHRQERVVLHRLVRHRVERDHVGYVHRPRGSEAQYGHGRDPVAVQDVGLLPPYGLHHRRGRPDDPVPLVRPELDRGEVVDLAGIVRPLGGVGREHHDLVPLGLQPLYLGLHRDDGAVHRGVERVCEHRHLQALTLSSFRRRSS